MRTYPHASWIKRADRTRFQHRACPVHMKFLFVTLRPPHTPWPSDTLSTGNVEHALRATERLS